MPQETELGRLLLAHHNSGASQHNEGSAGGDSSNGHGFAGLGGSLAISGRSIGLASTGAGSSAVDQDGEGGQTILAGNGQGAVSIQLDVLGRDDLPVAVFVVQNNDCLLYTSRCV